MNKDTTYDEIDLEQLEEEFAKKNNISKKNNNKKLEKNGTAKSKRPKTPKISVNQQQQDANPDTSVSGEDQTPSTITNHVDDEVIVNDVTKKISNISDPGYQANMRFLMQRPKSSLVMNGGGLVGGGYSRPSSASFINGDSRPPSRSTSASSMIGRSRSPGILAGPYLTEPLRPSRPSSGMYHTKQVVYNVHLYF